MSELSLRSYQEAAVEATRGLIRSGRRRILLNAPTGAGKTVIAAHIIASAAAKGNRTLFLAHLRELISQCSDKLEEGGVADHGIIMAGATKKDSLVQVASVQTLARRQLPEADLIIIDEAHRALAPTYMDIVRAYPRAIVLGLTATPERTDGQGLDELFEDIVVVSTVPKLIGDGYLIQPQGYDAPKGEKLAGDIVTNWLRLAPGRLTVAFGQSVEHAMDICAQFRAAGVAASWVSDQTAPARRDETLAAWRAGSIRVVANYGLFVEGFDMPDLSCAIVARALGSESLWVQICGRVMRVAPGKDSSIILDHGGNWARYGGPHLERVWSLRGEPKKETAETLATCQECARIYESTPRFWLDDERKKKAERALAPCPGCRSAACRACGEPFTVQGAKADLLGVAWTKEAICPHCQARYTDDVAHIEGEGEEPPEHTDAILTAAEEESEEAKARQDYRKFLETARKKGYKRGWVFWQLRRTYPPDLIQRVIPRHTSSWWKK